MSTLRALPSSALLCLALLFGACGAPDPAVAGGQSLDERQAPPTVDQTAWFRPSPEAIYCVIAPCPTILMRGVNGAPSRYVTDVDLSELGLPAARAGDLGLRLDTLLVQGRFRELDMDGRPYLIFQASRGMEAIAPAGAEEPERDGYYAVQAGAGCIDDSCLTFVARLLGGGAEEMWAALDLRPLRLSEADELALMLQLRSGRLVLSRRPPPPSWPEAPVVVTQAFRPITAQVP
jgi:hypothetical protein